MGWPWLVGLLAGIGFILFMPSLQTKRPAQRVALGLLAGVGVTVLINAGREIGLVP